MKQFVLLSLVLAIVHVAYACKCYIPYEEQYGKKIEHVVKRKQPHEYLKASDLPDSWDWRNINGTNFGSRVLTQQNPAVCGSCWAEAVTGALSDRYNIATNGKLQIQLAPQQLLNFYGETTGGTCNGGDSDAGNAFIYKYGITDDTCAPFLGVNWPHGFEVAKQKTVDGVQSRMRYICDWEGVCGFVPKSDFNIYGVEEYGSVTGEENMMAEIYARGPIACSLNSEADEFDDYHGGIITCKNSKNEKKCTASGTDHVIVIAGWGVDKATGMKYWVGRNSYGTRWGEGAGGGWFRLERGVDALNMESHDCRWAVPASTDVQRALDQYNASL